MRLIEHYPDTEDPRDTAEARPARRARGATNVLVYTVLRHYRLIVLLCLVGGLVGFVMGAIRINVYRSHGKLWLRSGMREAATLEEAVAPGSARSPSRPSAAIQAELHLLRNTEVFERVVQRLGAQAIIAIPDPRRYDNEQTGLPSQLLHRFQAWWIGVGLDDQAEPDEQLAIEILQFGIQLHADSDSGVIWVYYEGNDPAMTQRIVNTYLEVAEAYHTEYFRVSKKQKIARAAQEDAQAAYRAADEALKDFKSKHGLFDLRAQETQLSTRIAEATAELDADRKQIRTLEARIRHIEDELDSEDPIADRLEELVANPEYEMLRSRRQALASELASMVKRSGELPVEFDQRKLPLQQQIEILDRDLQQTPAIVRQDTTRRLDMLGRLDIAREDLSALNGATETKDRQLESLREELQRIQRLETEFETLTIRRTQALEAFNEITRNLDRLSMLGRMDDDQIGNLRVFQQAHEPGEKIGPNRTKSLLFGLILGGLAGCAIAFGLVVADPIVRRPSDLTKLDELELLALAPLFRGRERREPGLPADSRSRRPEFWQLVDRLWPLLATSTESKEGPHGIAFLSDRHDAGNSTVAAAAAVGLAQHTRSRVLLVEAAASPGGIARRFDVDHRPGLHELLRGECKESEVVRPSGVDGLDLVCNGEGEHFAAGSFAVPENRALLDRLASGYDYVLWDLAPLDRQSEGRHLLQRCDQVLLVLRQDRTKKASIERTLQELRRTGIAPDGAILTHARSIWPFWLPFPDPELARF